jgi:hypothetical protein
MAIDFEDIVPVLQAVNDDPKQKDSDEEEGYHPMLISAE